MLANMGWFTMDNNGNFTLEILVVGMIILMILGIISVASEISQEKISKSVENNNIEKAISEVADTLINDPGSPINWEDFKSKRVGLAIINEYGNVIPNSVSYFKFLELGRDYENLVTKRLFLKKTDYYLLINDSERLENKYSIDTTHFKSQRGESISSTRIYLNDKLNELFEVNDTSSIVFIHFDKKDTKAVLVGIPRDFDKNKLNYNYFTTQPCDFVIKAWS